MRALPPNKQAELDEARRAPLRVFLRECLSQNICSMSDLRNPIGTLAKLGSTLVSDLRVVCSEALVRTGAIGTSKAAEGFFELFRLK